MKDFLVIKSEAIKMEVHNGLFRQVLLEDSNGQVKIYRYTLKAGNRFEPELYALKDKLQMFFFTNPTGYVATKNRAWNITEQAAFIPNFDKEAFWFEAGEDDLEFIHIIGIMNEWDVENYIDYHIITPRFKKVSEGMSYKEYHSGNAGSRIESRFLVEDTACGRWSLGIQKGTGSDFVGEHLHDELDQWTYVLPGSTFRYCVNGQTFTAEEGNLVYIPRGMAHSIQPEDRGRINYLWLKLAVDGFSVGRDGYPGSEH